VYHTQEKENEVMYMFNQHAVYKEEKREEKKSSRFVDSTKREKKGMITADAQQKKRSFFQ